MEKHLHKYRRTDIGVRKHYIVHRCVKDCTHYIPLLQRDEKPFWSKSSKSPIIGKRAECWKCGEEFIITFISSIMEKPHCVDCIKRKGDITDAMITDILDETNPISSTIDEILERFR